MTAELRISPQTPLGRAVEAGAAALRRGNATQIDAAYLAAVDLAAAPGADVAAVGEVDLWALLAADHLAALRQAGALARGLRHAGHYLTQAGATGADPRQLLLERAQLRGAAGDLRGAGADAAAVRTSPAGCRGPLSAAAHGRLLRLEALAAADAGDRATAVRLLAEAERALLAAGDPTISIIERDRALLAVRAGVETRIADVLAGPRPDTVAGQFRLALALRRQLRYEAAARVMLDLTTNPDLDEALRLPALVELATLLFAVRWDKAAQALRPELDKAAARWSDPAEAARWIARAYASAPEDLAPAGRPAGTVTGPQPAVMAAFDHAVRHVQALIAEQRLDVAEAELARLGGPPAPADPPGGSGAEALRAAAERDLALWHLTAGELQLARCQQNRQPQHARAAAEEFGQAVRHAQRPWLAGVRARALRLLGEARHRLAEHDEAVRCWADAHDLEEQIAGRQISDTVRIGMLQSVADEHDERIRLAAERATRRGGPGEPGVAAVASLVVAMEAARGAAILGRILPAEDGRLRQLPTPDDDAAAWTWLRATANQLPRDQAVWLTHATPFRLHHAVLGRDQLFHVGVDCRRDELAEAVDELAGCWSEEMLESPVGRDAFDAAATRIAELIGLADVLRQLPPRLRRLALVPGGILADVPFAALPTSGWSRPVDARPGPTLPLGLRVALSELPCLSARRPLARRSQAVRGERHLLVSPPAEGITPARGRPGGVLGGDQATPDRLRAALGERRHRQVRLDCHGGYDPQHAWLQLAPAGPAGRLLPEQLQAMDLGGCGTLMLGACESGMATRIGRDERTGFVRAGLHAGAAAVVAARWVAADPVAAAVLDRFRHHLRHLPRDLALHQAQREIHTGAPADAVRRGWDEVAAPDHPARWACWTLYGDAGWQTAAGPVRRRLRRATSGAGLGARSERG
ncbi:CHAT domain-containing protein [Frankia sp. AgB32]|uniref:CHAT domain-containing protein n=1 Tax=Frankia sp. AgB32 TaxID=631119 RepID=UPI00200F9308|nr:CHAT domain-containing protein [Frankia sp. AgB32]MCK9897837.1 CHAT domain-containing protein [Frankia sp. AgB32]